MRKPAAPPSRRASSALTRFAAASVNVIGLKGLRIDLLHPRELYHTQRQLGSLGHAVAVPGRIPYQLDIDFPNGFNGPHGVLHHIWHGAGDRAAGGRQRHLDGHVAAGRDVDVVDEPELVDIHGNLGVIDRVQGLDHAKPQRLDRIGIERPRRRRRFGLLHVFGPGRRFLHDQSRSSLSVLTFFCRLSSAAISVCQESVAHFTRIGYSRTPDSTVSLSSSPAAAPWQALLPVISPWKRSNSARASSSVLPLMISVISEAEAMEMAQPRPWKPTSATLPSSMVRNTATLSPHRGLSPLASWLACSGRRKFRGWRLWSRMTS